MESGTSKATTTANEQRKRTKDEMADETPRVKRQRVSRACDQCRAGREKCDGIKPKCGTCAFSERSCTYDTQAKKRGIQPGYIRTLELSLAWVFSKYPNTESTLKRELAIENSQVQKLLSSKEGSESDRLHIRWSKGIVCKQIDQLLSGVEVVSPSQFGPEHDVSTSDDILRDMFPAEDGSILVDEHTGSTSLFNVDMLQAAPTSDSPRMPGGFVPDTTQEKSILHLPADFWRLLDVYYSFTHSWLPISEKHDMLKTAYSYPPEGLRIEASDAGSGNHAELWAIFALASHQSSPRKDQNEIDVFMTTARELLPGESGPFELGHVRCLILLSLIHVGRGYCTPAWVLIGFAIRIAYELRLHKRVDTHLPRRKHVYLACYVIESILGKLYGMPFHLRGQGLDPLLLLEEDGLEEWNPWDGGIIVTTQQNFGLSRKPAQSISVFNRLLTALRNVEESSTKLDQQNRMQSGRRPTISAIEGPATQQSDETNERRGLSDLRQPQDRKKRGSLDDTDHWTPQQLHFEIIDLWLRIDQSSADAKESWPFLTQKIKTYIHCFGASRIPPTTVPLLERLLSLYDLDFREVNLRNVLATLAHTWRREAPIQAIAFQTTPGQDASPASVLGEPLGPIHRYSTSSGLPHLHPMNPPIYSNSFGIDSVTYRPIPPQLEPQGMEHSSITSQPHISSQMEPGSGGAFMSTAIQPSSKPAINPPIDFAAQEATQTADLEAIFEEIAMLDGNRQDDDRPEFMRNLGLGPDLDLSAFFGADYQPTDPLFSYLQPDTFTNEAGGQNVFEGG